MKDFIKPKFIYPKTYWLKYSVPEEHDRSAKTKTKAELSLLDFSGYFGKQDTRDTKKKFIASGYLQTIKSKARPNLCKKSESTNSLHLKSEKSQSTCKLKKILVKSYTRNKSTQSRINPQIPSENLPFKIFSSRNLSPLKDLSGKSKKLK